MVERVAGATRPLAELLYEEHDALTALKAKAEKELLAESGGAFDHGDGRRSRRASAMAASDSGGAGLSRCIPDPSASDTDYDFGSSSESVGEARV